VLAPNAIIELFQLQLVAALHGTSDIYYFHAGVNAAISGDIVFDGDTYVRCRFKQKVLNTATAERCHGLR
jgi:hypothetical protein